MRPSRDLIIVGGGIVGLATAYQCLLRHPGLNLLLLEKEAALAAHQTGRNSGVIHSGLYYRPDSLKARNCRLGYQQLLAFCQERDIPHEICGKLVVATTSEELPRLRALQQRAAQNGLGALPLLGPEAIREREPHAAGMAALHVPQTGIVDYRAVCQALASEIERRGGEIQCRAPVLSLGQADGRAHVETPDALFHACAVCVCAGLHSDRLAQLDDPELPLRIIPFRGEYFQLAPDKRNLVRHLIYPVPDPAFPFLGVHFTRMIDGSVEAGPNAVLALAREGYAWSDLRLRDLADTLAWPGFWTLARKHWRMGGGEILRSLSKSAFTRALQRLLPAIQSEDLLPAPAGVRAQACHYDGSLLDDFHFHRRGRILHVCNAPSPAATASLAIGLTICHALDDLLPRNAALKPRARNP